MERSMAADCEVMAIIFSVIATMILNIVLKWLDKKYSQPNENKMKRCTRCGETRVVELVDICPACLEKITSKEDAQRLRNISDILRISENSDGNIKECIKGILEVAADLEVLGDELDI